jgi:hypothetical protein
MKNLAVALVLAGAVWGCDARAATAPVAKATDGATYTERVKIDDV